MKIDERITHLEKRLDVIDEHIKVLAEYLHHLEKHQ